MAQRTLLNSGRAHRALQALLGGDFRGSVSRYLVNRRRERFTAHLLSDNPDNLDDVEAFIVDQPTRLNAPLVLISQVQRSGGTLLSQLFDGHPAIAAHPHELSIGHPTDEYWPELGPADGAERNFRKLFDIGTIGLMRRGYTKGDRNPEPHHFFLVPRIQYRIFLHLFETAPPCNDRGILDHFFTSYFNAWLNYQGNVEDKRWITGFAPRLAHHEASVAGFFQSYPDGRLIQIIRDPRTWYPSAKQHQKSGHVGKGAEAILATWCLSAESICRNKRTYGDKVIVLRFEDLVGNTERTMHLIAQELGIAYNSELEEPTFNGEAMRANSSFAVDRPGIIDAPLKRHNMLGAEESRLVDQRCMTIYERALAKAVQISGAVSRTRAGS
jgi:hypothetical protein